MLTSGTSRVAGRQPISVPFCVAGRQPINLRLQVRNDAPRVVLNRSNEAKPENPWQRVMQPSPPSAGGPFGRPTTKQGSESQSHSWSLSVRRQAYSREKPGSRKKCATSPKLTDFGVALSRRNSCALPDRYQHSGPTAIRGSRHLCSKSTSGVGFDEHHAVTCNRWHDRTATPRSREHPPVGPHDLYGGTSGHHPLRVVPTKTVAGDRGRP
jgi:hypothetical protein